MKKLIMLSVIVNFMYINLKAQLKESNEKINITTLKAYEKDAKIYIDWTTDGNSTSNCWEVQSSQDGVQFSTIALVLGPDPREKGDRYEYRDKLNEINSTLTYFRVRHISKDGIYQVSEIVQPVK